MGKKKGEIPSIVIWLLVGVSILAVAFPLFASLRESARNSVYECQDTDYPVLSDTSWCLNETGYSYLEFNQSATPVGISTTENAMLLLLAILIIVGFVAYGAHKLELF